jgi:hypothetical protein
MKDDSSVFFSCSALSSALTMFKVVVNIFITFLDSFFTMLTMPDPLVQPLSTYRAFTRLTANKTYNLRTPLLIAQPLRGLLLHYPAKLNQLGLKLMTLIRSSLSIAGNILSRCETSVGDIPVQLSAYRRGVNSNLLSNHFLFHSCLNKGLKLIPLYQTELCVVFRLKQFKDYTTPSNDKIPSKAFCHLFSKIALIT